MNADGYIYSLIETYKWALANECEGTAEATAELIRREAAS